MTRRARTDRRRTAGDVRTHRVVQESTAPAVASSGDASGGGAPAVLPVSTSELVPTQSLGAPEATASDAGVTFEAVLAHLKDTLALPEPGPLAGTRTFQWSPLALFEATQVRRPDVAPDDDLLLLTEEPLEDVDAGRIRLGNQWYRHPTLMAYATGPSESRRPKLFVLYDKALLARGVLTEVRVLEEGAGGIRREVCRCYAEDPVDPPISNEALLNERDRYIRVLENKRKLLEHEYEVLRAGLAAAETRGAALNARERLGRRLRRTPIVSTPEVGRTRAEEHNAAQADLRALLAQGTSGHRVDAHVTRDGERDEDAGLSSEPTVGVDGAIDEHETARPSADAPRRPRARSAGARGPRGKRKSEKVERAVADKAPRASATRPHAAQTLVTEGSMSAVGAELPTSHVGVNDEEAVTTEPHGPMSRATASASLHSILVMAAPQEGVMLGSNPVSDAEISPATEEPRDGLSPCGITPGETMVHGALESAPLGSRVHGPVDAAAALLALLADGPAEPLGPLTPDATDDALERGAHAE